MAAVSQTLHVKVKGSPAFEESPSITLVSCEPKSKNAFTAAKRAISYYIAKSTSPENPNMEYRLFNEDDENVDIARQKAVEKMFYFMMEHQIDVIPEIAQGPLVKV